MKELDNSEMMEIEGGGYAVKYQITKDSDFYPDTEFSKTTDKMNTVKSSYKKIKKVQKGKYGYANYKLIKTLDVNGKKLNNMVCLKYDAKEWGYTSLSAVKEVKQTTTSSSGSRSTSNNNGGSTTAQKRPATPAQKYGGNSKYSVKPAPSLTAKPSSAQKYGGNSKYSVK